MPEPTQNLQHVDDALARLSSYLKSKTNVKALFRSRASVRVDVSGVQEDDLIDFTLGACQVTTIVGQRETDADVATRLVELLNGDQVSVNLESFEGFALGSDLLGPGVQGTWAIALDEFGAPVDRPVIGNEYARTGAHSAHFQYPTTVVPSGGGVTATNASIIAFNEEDGGVQTVEFFVRVGDNFPGTGFPPLGLFQMLWGAWGFIPGAPVGLFFGLYYDIGTDQILMIAGEDGGALFLQSPLFPGALLTDGAFHKITFGFHNDGSNAELYFDDVLFIDGAMPNPFVSSALALTSIYINNTAGTYNDADLDYWLDDLTFGKIEPCGDYDLNKYKRTLPQDIESVPLGDPLEGTVGPITWDGWSFGPVPPPSYVDDFRAVDDFSASGTKSLRSNLTGLTQPPPNDVTFANMLAAIDYPGNATGRQDIEFRLRLDPTFPGTELPNGWGLWAPAVFFFAADFASYQIVASVSVTKVDGVVTSSLFIALPNEDFSSITTVEFPLSYLLDGKFHFFRAYLRSDTMTAVAEIDGGVYRAERSLEGLFSEDALRSKGLVLVTTAVPDLNLGGAPFVSFDAPNIWIDDIVVGGTFPRVLSARASKYDEDDPHFYIQRLREPGKALDFSTNSSRLSFRYIGLIDQLQELEDTLFDILAGRALEDAIGIQLDKIGDIVGLERALGQSDNDYRALLRVQIQSNLSNGEAWRLIEIVQSFTSSTLVQLQEFFPAHMQITFDGEVPNPSDLLRATDDAAAGGVSLVLIQQPEFPFVFDGDADGGGFDDGEFSGTVTTV